MNQEKIGIGILLPIFKTTSEFNQSFSTTDQIKANLHNLILTNKNERIMRPNFGCNLYASLFENITPETESNIKNTITEQINFWLPYINIKELNVTADSIKNTIYINIVYSINGNSIKFDSISLELNQLK